MCYLEEAIVVTDLLAFVKAIDETVWSIIQDDNKTTFVSNTIYMQAQSLAQTAHIFSSYNVVNWLKKYDAVIDEKVRWTKHSYTSRPDNDDLMVIGELDLTLNLNLVIGRKKL